MTRSVGLVCAPVLIASACRNVPGPFAPPVQRQPLADFRPYRASAIVDMSDEDAKTHFIQDFSSKATPMWRWTAKRPAVRVRMRTSGEIRYTIDFVIGEAMLRDVGPITVSFFVNDIVLGKIRYVRDGVQHFEKAIPAGLVTEGQDVTVGAEIDKTWVPPEGGPAVGIMLMRIGLTQ
jgi:hypothetical protein